MAGSDTGLDAMHVCTLELDHLGAVEADEVLMDRLRRQTVLVSLESLPEVALGNQFTGHEQVQSPVDGGLPDPLAIGSQYPFDLVHGQMTLRSEYDARDEFPLVRDREGLLFQVTAKEPEEGTRIGVGLHVSTGSKRSASNSSINSWNFSGSPEISTDRISTKSQNKFSINLNRKKDNLNS